MRLRLTDPLLVTVVFVALALLIAIGPGDAAIAGRERPTATIGGTPVPSHLDCEEDEVIAFTAIDTLDCVLINHLNLGR